MAPCPSIYLRPSAKLAQVRDKPSWSVYGSRLSWITWGRAHCGPRLLFDANRTKWLVLLFSALQFGTPAPGSSLPSRPPPLDSWRQCVANRPELQCQRCSHTGDSRDVDRPGAVGTSSDHDGVTLNGARSRDLVHGPVRRPRGTTRIRGLATKPDRVRMAHHSGRHSEMGMFETISIRLTANFDSRVDSSRNQYVKSMTMQQDPGEWYALKLH
ncbi:hypothetical protein C8Q80DRAFT_641225 [Daedaleopsis nitida]|nr:hypothetical protein C8Q80DRAFT_641225 [Daedaleopsis nitida]